MIDVFIWKFLQMLENNKRFTFAFIRYYSIKKMRKAILQANFMEEGRVRKTYKKALVSKDYQQSMNSSINILTKKVVKIVDINVEISDSDIDWTKMNAIACMKESLSL
ncbi:Uncharacterized protein TCM_018869 [Theobroma cacao]|uniref:Uncharacterized protein n=1 Tax=Theobroma cacao TaxID=3641 RepID=A0A061EH67_THECC|nr:Uncharacterized protein TCM_018869 [Theobroma cacao]